MLEIPVILFHSFKDQISIYLTKPNQWTMQHTLFVQTVI